MNITLLILLVLFLVLTFIVYYSLNKVNETLNKKLSNLQGEFTNHLVASQGTVSSVTKNLTELEKATQDLIKIGKNIQSLQDILKPPKLRGVFGELLLENALSQVLHPKFYEVSYKFKTGDIVDAVIKLRDNKILCIDSKFPLDSIKDHLSGNDEIHVLPPQFKRDVKKHIDSISSKYILPQEDTLDVALMYVPAERIYYEIVSNDNQLFDYSVEKHVIPVSPGTLYVYLSTVLVGLKGMEIEKNAKQILVQIGDLKVSMDYFLNEFNTLGTHINNAKTKYDDSTKAVSELYEKLKNIEVSSTSK